MPWVRLDDSFADHPKIERAGPLAAWLHVAALCYCARQLTDGRIPKPKALRLTDIPNPAKHISALLDAGLWAQDGNDYVIHDYLDYQPSRSDVEAERSAARDRMAAKRRRKSDGTFAKSSGELPANNGRSSENVRPPRGSPTPSRPDPTPNTSLSSSSDSRPHPQPVDDDEIPAEVWDHYATLRYALEPIGSVRSPRPWKTKCAANAQIELAEQALRWWRLFDIDPYRLAQALVDGQPPRNIPRRQEITP